MDVAADDDLNCNSSALASSAVPLTLVLLLSKFAR